MKIDKVVAIDGPSGSGKSSIARDVANKMQFLYVDTGAMYRSLGFYLDFKGIDLVESKKLNACLKNLNFTYGESSSVLVRIDGKDLTEKIREHHVSELASMVSQIKEVREFLTQTQRDLVNQNLCVMEGRDIGTVVFPNSFCKIYLTAQAEVRAERRLKQLNEQGNNNLSYEEILADIKSRDARDIGRIEAPLKQAEDAVLLDTSDLKYDQVTSEVINIINKKRKDLKLDL